MFLVVLGGIFLRLNLLLFFQIKILLEIYFFDGLREGIVFLEIRGKVSIDEEVEVVIVMIEEISVDIVLDIVWDVWEDFGIRQGNILD